VAIEKLTERVKPLREAFPTGAAGSEHGVQSALEIVRELTEERSDECISAQALPPERRPGSARRLGNALQNKTTPAALAKDADGRAAQLWIDYGRT